MLWSVTDVDEWLHAAVDTPRKYVRHADDDRFKSRVLPTKQLQEAAGEASPDSVGQVHAIPEALLNQTLKDVVTRLGGEVQARRVAVVLRDFPFPHAPDVSVLIDPRLPPHEFLRLHHRACVAVATALATLKLKLDRSPADKSQRRGETESATKQVPRRAAPKRSGVILPGRAGLRFVELPFLPHAPTLQLPASSIYLTHHTPSFTRGNGELGEFDLFRMRATGGGDKPTPDRHALDIVVYHEHDQELQRLFFLIASNTEHTPVPEVLTWTQAFLVKEMETALTHGGSGKTGYMGYKWGRLSEIVSTGVPAKDLPGV